MPSTNINIQEIHEKTLKIFLEYRKRTDRTFYLRSSNNKNRLSEGFWFQGDNNYIFSSPFKPSDTIDYTQRIGFKIEVTSAGPKCYISYVYRDNSQEFQTNKQFYIALLNYFKIAYSEINIRHIKTIELSTDFTWEDALRKFLSEDVEEIIRIAKEHNVSDNDLFFDESDFYRKLEKINEIRFINQNGEKIEKHENIKEQNLNDSKRNYYILGSKYGENANQDVFQTMLEKEAISTAFASHINLEEYYLKSHSEITDFLKEQGEESKSYSALKKFLSLKTGDRIAIKADGSPKGKKGFLSIIEIAEVIEKDGEIYKHDPNGLGHLVNVKFIKAPVYKEFKIGGYGSTIHKLSKPDHIDLIFKSDYEILNISSNLKDYQVEFTNWLANKYGENSGTISSYIKAINILSKILSNELFKIIDDNYLDSLYNDLIQEQGNQEGKYYHSEAPSYGNYGFYSASIKSYREFLKTINQTETNIKGESMKFPLNTILYGPPGTGKTYNTILRAAEIIENRKIDTYDEALEIFQVNLHNQIEFITFHQNYSYEDFIQGLRPETDNKSSLVFDKKDGVFLKIATNALFEYYKLAKELEVTNSEDEIDLNETYLDFVQHLKTSEKKDFKTSSRLTIQISGFTINDNIKFRHNNSSRDYLVSGNRLIKLYNAFPNIKNITNVHNDILEAIGGCNTTVYWVALKEFISFINTISESSKIDETDNEKYDELSYDSKKKLLTTVDLDFLRKTLDNQVKVKNYVIIIDEINRANISRVFGELITLIEPDKRSHGDIPLEAQLPSGDPFIVPSNLYIIGTMNTADKSIALLDVALRRRFEFESMYPKYNEKDTGGEKIHDTDILQKINEKIIQSKGHDFQIGHAYFMGEGYDLIERMNKKVIPLLLEYYMNDEKEVKEILTFAGLIIEENSWPLKISGKNGKND